MPLRKTFFAVLFGQETGHIFLCFVLFFSQFSVIGKQTSGIQMFQFTSSSSLLIPSVPISNERYPSNFRINGKTWVITVIDSVMMLCLALIFFSEEDEQTHQVASSIWYRFSWHHIYTHTHTLISTFRLISTQFTRFVEFYIIGSNRCRSSNPLIT